MTEWAKVGYDKEYDTRYEKNSAPVVLIGDQRIIESDDIQMDESVAIDLAKNINQALSKVAVKRELADKLTEVLKEAREQLAWCNERQVNASTNIVMTVIDKVLSEYEEATK